MKKLSFLFKTLLLGSLLAVNSSVLAEEEEEEDAAPAETHYVELTPAFIVNLGEKPNKLNYLKTEIQLVVQGEDLADKVRFHIAPIRHNVLMLLSSKTKTQMLEDNVRETLQQEVMETLNTQMAEMDQSIVVDEVLFTTFIVQ